MVEATNEITIDKALIARDTSEIASRASADCCSSESDSGKTLLLGVGERGILRRVVKGGKDGMLNLPISWNNQCSQ